MGDEDDGIVPLAKPQGLDAMKPSTRRGVLGTEVIKRVEDNLFEKAGQIVGYSLDFLEVEPDNQDQMDETEARWAEEMGCAVEAKKRMRAAKHAWMSQKSMPGGMKMAMDLYVGIMKAKSKETVNHIELHGDFTVVNSPQPQTYEAVMVEADDE